MEAILEQLLRSPKFPRWVDELNEARRQEEVARAGFRVMVEDEDVRAEFINGEVVPHVTSRDQHTTTIRNISRLLDIFAQLHACGVVRTEQALTEFTRNDYAPDICFWGKPKAEKVVPATTVYPVPDLIGEVISPSTVARDRGVKFEDYAAHGVIEYWIIDPERRSIEQYAAREGKYELIAKFENGVIQSVAVTGFKMPVAAAFDEHANLNALWAMKPG